MANTPSPAGKVNGADLKSLFITALLLAVSAFFTGMIEHIGLLSLDPTMTLVVTGILTMFLKFIQKLVSGGSTQ